MNNRVFVFYSSFKSMPSLNMFHEKQCFGFLNSFTIHSTFFQVYVRQRTRKFTMEGVKILLLQARDRSNMSDLWKSFCDHSIDEEEAHRLRDNIPPALVLLASIWTPIPMILISILILRMKKRRRKDRCIQYFAVHGQRM